MALPHGGIVNVCYAQFPRMIEQPARVACTRDAEAGVMGGLRVIPAVFQNLVEWCARTARADGSQVEMGIQVDDKYRGFAPLGSKLSRPQIGQGSGGERRCQ